MSVRQEDPKLEPARLSIRSITLASSFLPPHRHSKRQEKRYSTRAWGFPLVRGTVAGEGEAGADLGCVRAFPLQNE
jgi:hypothetical protein